MNRAYWDAQVDTWDDEIFDSLTEDRRGVIRRAVRRAARHRDSVIDFGCGIGGYLPLLARSFARVHAVDWSPRCVAHARRRVAALPNVVVERSTPRALARLHGRFGCAVAANVLIHPSGRARDAVWRALRRMLRRGGTAIIVVPALESAALCEFVRRRVAPRRASAYDFHPPLARAEAGVVGIDGVPTKHYTADELSAQLAAVGFGLTRRSRVHYAWETELLSPPAHLSVGEPWDWLAEAEAV